MVTEILIIGIIFSALVLYYLHVQECALSLLVHQDDRRISYKYPIIWPLLGSYFQAEAKGYRVKVLACELGVLLVMAYLGWRQ